MATDHRDRTHASTPPPVVAVEVIRKGGALVALETYGWSVALFNGMYLARLLVGSWTESEPLFTVLVLNVVALAFGTARLWARRDHRLELSALGMNVVAGAWHSRALSWTEITELEQQRILGSEELTAVVAGRTYLRTPLLSSGWGPWRDPDYEAKAQRIRDHWTAYRWSSFPPPGDRPPPPTPST